MKKSHNDKLMLNSSDNKNFKDLTMSALCELHVDQNCLLTYNFSQFNKSTRSNAQFDQLQIHIQIIWTILLS